ncbi:MAG: polyhydroxyalkanoic acid system family protein [Alphaproteobacteria bacterium]|nr:polyhydroxyalkanoic acid system family protein [Alphaproteobacteria bacterium]
MSDPVVVTISHSLGRDAAKERLDRGLGGIRAQLLPLVQGLDYQWEGYRLTFHVAALRQQVSGQIDVLEDNIRVEIRLPLLLRLLGGKIVGRVRQQATALLEKPPAPR